MATNNDEPGAGRGAQDSWRSRPAIALAVRVAVVAVPVAISVGVAMLTELLVPQPSGTFGRVAWWIGVLGVSTLALYGCERFARRALPLAALLKMGMLFPGVAPKRLAVARRAASTRDLERRLEEARSHGVDDEPALAAERIVSLAASLSAHDRKTRGHTERVRALTDLVADELRLPSEDRDRLRWSALLHDIGKLAVHPDILNKEGPLSDDEWALMKQHPLEGARLTAPLEGWLGEWASTIAEHHERFDGGGYPYGLVGDQISLGGRIVAVADTYDVMTSARSYKRPSSPEAARNELVRCAGSQFDPAVVRAFLAVPVRRLRGLAPLSWLGSLPFGGSNLGMEALARGAAALLAVGSIVGLTTLRSSGGTGVAAVAAGAGGRGGTSLDGGLSSGGTSGSNGDRGLPAGWVSSSGTDGSGGSGTGGPGGTDGTTPGGGRGSGSGTGSGSGGGSGSQGGNGNGGTTSGSGPGTTYPNGTGTTVPGSPPTTSAPGSTPTTNPGSPPTTDPGSPPTTSPPPSSTTTTTTSSLPAPTPPTGLHGTGACEALILVPEVKLTWTDSSSYWVTGYEILRSSNGTSYSGIASVSSSATSYTDTSVSGLDTTYWYEVEALSPEGTATSAAVKVTTPTLCV
jgi:putative nucleotidyltransferase with HDIG domain